MNVRTLGRAGLGLTAALAFAVTGCTAEPTTGGANPPAAPESSAADAAAVLTASADSLAGTSVRLEMEVGEFLTATGAVDPATQAGTMTMSMDFGAVDPSMDMTMDMEMIFIGTDAWVNLGEAGAALGAQAEWMQLDMSRLTGGVMGFGADQVDPAQIGPLLGALDNAEQVDDRTYRAEVDLTQVPGTAYTSDALLDAYGDAATAVPVTITLDEAGRPASLTMELPEAPGVMPAQTVHARYFDYGTEVEVAPPPADQVAPAPDSIYGVLETQV